jgi:biotin-dependent carboxylase-like uncharacterized protein
MGLTINSAGLLSTVQDGGRRGYMQFGFQASGAMDKKSMAIANYLVGNDRGEGVIEMTMAGISASFDSDCVIALTGADVAPKLNGAPMPMYTAVCVKAGDSLKCGFAQKGCRAYLAVAGGLDVKSVLGSQSTNLKCKIGGFEGRALAAGDKIGFRKAVSTLLQMEYRHLAIETEIRQPQTVRVVTGLQLDYFSDKGVKTFFETEYTLSADSDRMGIKLEGEAVESKNGVDIISDGIPLGGIQIPSSGKPIIMMADRQTTGGYAKIATVISADIAKLAQLKPGDSVRFKEISLKKAQRIYKKEERFLKAVSKLWKKQTI